MHDLTPDISQKPISSKDHRLVNESQPELTDLVAPDFPKIKLKFQNLKVVEFSNGYDLVFRYYGKTGNSKIAEFGLNFPNFKSYNSFIEILTELDSKNSSLNSTLNNKNNYISRENLKKLFHFIQEEKVKFSILGGQISSVKSSMSLEGAFNFSLRAFQDSKYHSSNIKSIKVHKNKDFKIYEISICPYLAVTEKAVRSFLKNNASRSLIDAGNIDDYNCIKLNIFNSNLDLTFKHPYRDECLLFFNESKQAIIFHKDGQPFKKVKAESNLRTKLNTSEEFLEEYLDYSLNSNYNYVNDIKYPIHNLLTKIVKISEGTVNYDDEFVQKIEHELNHFSDNLSEIKSKLLENNIQVLSLLRVLELNSTDLINGINDTNIYKKSLNNFITANNELIKVTESLISGIQEETGMSSNIQQISYHKKEFVSDFLQGISGMSLAGVGLLLEFVQAFEASTPRSIYPAILIGLGMIPLSWVGFKKFKKLIS